MVFGQVFFFQVAQRGGSRRALHASVTLRDKTKNGTLQFAQQAQIEHRCVLFERSSTVSLCVAR